MIHVHARVSARRACAGLVDVTPEPANGDDTPAYVAVEARRNLQRACLGAEAHALPLLIETVASVALYWRLRAELTGSEGPEVERTERRALQVVGVTFVALAAQILYEADST